jgi:hypothetical protein
MLEFFGIAVGFDNKVIANGEISRFISEREITSG